jgi:hypothetical protein
VAAARALRDVLAHLPKELAAKALLEEFSWVDVLPAACTSWRLEARFATSEAEKGWEAFCQESGSGTFGQTV